MLKTKERKKRKSQRTIFGTLERPRLSVFRSGQHIYAQIIDDSKGVTLGSAADLKLKGSNLEKAFQVGKALALVAKAKKIKKVVFDRGGFLYHGRIAKLAQGAREGGLEF